MLTEKELMNELKISRTTLWRLKKKGMPNMKVGSSYRYDKANVLKWVDNNQNGEYPIDYSDAHQISENLDLPLPYNSLKPSLPKIKNNYKITIPYLLKHNKEYLSKLLTIEELKELQSTLTRYANDFQGNEAIKFFTEEYLSILKKRYQNEYIENCDPALNRFINKNGDLKILWGDCLKVLQKCDQNLSS